MTRSSIWNHEFGPVSSAAIFAVLGAIIMVVFRPDPISAIIGALLTTGLGRLAWQNEQGERVAPGGQRCVVSGVWVTLVLLATVICVWGLKAAFWVVVLGGATSAFIMNCAGYWHLWNDLRHLVRRARPPVR